MYFYDWVLVGFCRFIGLRIFIRLIFGFLAKQNKTKQEGMPLFKAGHRAGHNAGAPAGPVGTVAAGGLPKSRELVFQSTAGRIVILVQQSDTSRDTIDLKSCRNQRWALKYFYFFFCTLYLHFAAQKNFTLQ